MYNNHSAAYPAVFDVDDSGLTIYQHVSGGPGATDGPDVQPAAFSIINMNTSSKTSGTTWSTDMYYQQ